ncbi:hypothetical protein PHPALM_31646 [Phytophthora palmivora]|uniref:Uncharacterized protein n=1 Tax=Phytophthora palmivora TaxID=4796 RepID=A0A2P4X227_9STRA|nr:hypothetical protein PHPALM_31646 [Phytophthora palmivora]
MVIMQSNMQVEPRTVTCNVVIGLINAVREQFSVCHYRLSLPLEAGTSTHIMSTDVIDVLTVIPGIRIDEAGHRGKLSTFSVTSNEHG